MNYFLTFRCYGTWLHGDERGSVDRDNNAFATPLAEVNVGLQNYRRRLMKAERMFFDLPARQRTFAILDEAAAFRHWFVHAMNVQSNHVHLVITPPERVKPEKSWKF